MITKNKPLSYLNNIILLPIHFILLFSGSRSFTKNKLIGNVALNMLGLHVVRVTIAYCIIKFRRLFLINCLTTNEQAFFNKNGFLIVENVLPEDVLQTIITRSNKLIDNDYLIIENQGNTYTKRVLLDKESCCKIFDQNLYQYIKHNTKLNNALRYVAASKNPPFIYYLDIIHGDNANDPQKKFHRDTFFSSMKAWLFLEDVTLEDGPFQYIPGSHKLTLKRLYSEYKKSILCSMGKESNHYSKQGSFRFDENEILSIYNSAPKKFCVNRNTLVIADTFGIHKRSEAPSNKSRKSIWFYSRPNPFVPFPGLNLSLLNTLQTKVIKQIFKKKMKSYSL